MDEVPIVTANPIRPINQTQGPSETNKPKARKRVITFKENLVNWFFMLPLFLIAAVQLYFFGKTFGLQTTLPPTTFSSFIYLAILIFVLVLMHIQMRSMLFAMGTSTALLIGIFTAWFGDFMPLTIDNLTNIGDIMQLSWSKRNLPFDLLVTSGISISIILLAGIQFFVALIVKSFFEVFFGKEWGSGRLYGYIGACVILVVAQITFVGYRSFSSETSERLRWKVQLEHSPIEKFITRTPGEYLVSEKSVVFTNNQYIYHADLEKGTVNKTSGFTPFVVHSGFKKATDFLLFGSNGIQSYDPTLNSYRYRSSYPPDQRNLQNDKSEKADESSNKDKEKKQDITIPLTTYDIANGRLTLVYYNYGHLAMYENKTGRQLWFQQVDLGIGANLNFPETYLTEEGYFLDAGKRLILSCNNGVVKCLETLTGREIWSYVHSTPKLNGVSVRGLLSRYENNLVVAFRTGEILTFDLTDGRQLYHCSNPLFVAVEPVKVTGRKVEFFDRNGIYYKVDLDGGIIINSLNGLPTRQELAPILTSVNGPVSINGGKIYWLDVENKEPKLILELKNRSFITEPKFDDKIMYIGTIEGWVYCLHRETGHIKWVVKVDGELQKDSLMIVSNGLLVKSKSGSIYNFNTDFRN